MIDRRDFLKQASTTLAAGGVITTSPFAAFPAPAIQTGRVRPVVISDWSGYNYRNGGTENAVERAFRLITEGKDVLDALIEGVNIPELDPEETGIGYGAMPNADGIVQLDASCMHGPKRRAGAVAAIEGVRTPSQVAKAVAEFTDNHLLAGKGAQEFARAMGFRIEEDLNTERSRRLWLEWKRRVDPERWLDPDSPARRPPDNSRGNADSAAKALEAGRSMVRDGLIPEGSFWGTINCDAIGPNGDICGVTTTSGLAWKIPGRVGDSPILGAGLYVDNDVGAAGSTGRGEANLYNLSSFLIVESMRRGMSPKDAGMEALKRIRANTVERRLLNSRGLPNFNIRFFILNKRGETAGVSMYRAGETKYALCNENGAVSPDLEPLLPGTPEAD
ncbi:MAG TPA: N(4)-(beta-N-acetylglucosaminyl)-L-asparaginase [Gemmatimonadaceae bacterium]